MYIFPRPGAKFFRTENSSARKARRVFPHRGKTGSLIINYYRTGRYAEKDRRIPTCECSRVHVYNTTCGKTACVSVCVCLCLKAANSAVGPAAIASGAANIKKANSLAGLQRDACE